MERWLEHYAATFDTVELNNSFYRLPEADAFATWSRRVPRTFLFAVKASRYLTHLKRLREPREPLARLWSRAERLGDRLGPVLYQLPPRWHRDADRLARFIEALPSGHAQAIEFRDASWYRPDLLRLMDLGEVALCLHDMPGSATRLEPIGPFVYVRFHGASGKYRGSYSSQRLSAWAARMTDWADAGLPVFAYFNNDAAAQAVRDAARLREMVARRR